MIKKLFETRTLTPKNKPAKSGQPPTGVARSSHPLTRLYRKISGQALDLAVKPSVFGELPALKADDDTLTFYILQEYSRSNSILIDLQTREHQFPSALQNVEDSSHNINENAAIIFLNHPSAKNGEISPRLARLIDACTQYPELKIRLVPVTILWGRSPEKEDSLFKLLVAEALFLYNSDGKKK